MVKIVKDLLLPLLHFCMAQVEHFFADIILPAVRSAGLVMLDLLLVEMGALQRPRFSVGAGL